MRGRVQFFTAVFSGLQEGVVVSEMSTKSSTNSSYFSNSSSAFNHSGASQSSEVTDDTELTSEDISTVRKGRLVLQEEENDASNQVSLFVVQKLLLVYYLSCFLISVVF